MTQKEIETKFKELLSLREQQRAGLEQTQKDLMTLRKKCTHRYENSEIAFEQREDCLPTCAICSSDGGYYHFKDSEVKEYIETETKKGNKVPKSVLDNICTHKDKNGNRMAEFSHMFFEEKMYRCPNCKVQYLGQNADLYKGNSPTA